MPGDRYEDTLTISNKTSKAAAVLFKTDFKDSPFLDILQMDINSGNIFYRGAVANDRLKEYRQIANLAPGESKKIDVTLTLPAEADNDYQVNSDVATWYFAIEQETSFKTGDDINPWLVAGLCFVSAAAAFAIAVKKGRSGEDI